MIISRKDALKSIAKMPNVGLANILFEFSENTDEVTDIYVVDSYDTIPEHLSTEEVFYYESVEIVCIENTNTEEDIVND